MRMRDKVSIVASLAVLCYASFGIIGGKDAKDGEYPQVFSLSLRNNDGPAQCTATLVAPSLLITAAHCLYDTKATFGTREYDIREISNGADTHRRKSKRGYVASFNAKEKKHYYPTYPKLKAYADGLSSESPDKPTALMKASAYDIGYVHLTAAIPDATHGGVDPSPVYPAPSLEAMRALSLKIATVVGYGNTYYPVDPEKQDAGVKRYGIHQINAVHSPGVYYFEGATGNMSSGDSGGPVYLVLDGKTTQIGINSAVGGGSEATMASGAGALRPETLCWVAKDSGVSIPGVNCP